MPDDELSGQALRLALGAELSRRAVRCTGGRIAEVADARALLALAKTLAPIAESVARAHRLRFDPPYPGVSAGVQELGGQRRLLPGCVGRSLDGRAAVTVFTTLVPGRRPQVAAAPPSAAIPAQWRVTAVGPG